MDGGLTLLHNTLLTDLLDFLHIIRSQPYKDKDADDGNRPVEAGALQKNIHHRGQQDADQAHEHEGTHAGEVALGDQAIDGHGAEHGRSNKKGTGNGSAGVHQKEHGKGYPVHNRIGDEEPGRGARLQALNAGGQIKNQPDLTNQQKTIK